MESICSLRPTEEGSEYARKGLELLIPALLETKANPENLEARLNAQKGGAYSMKPFLLEDVPVGMLQRLPCDI